jgi:hypothetical protein
MGFLCFQTQLENERYEKGYLEMQIKQYEEKIADLSEYFLIQNLPKFPIQNCKNLL